MQTFPDEETIAEFFGAAQPYMYPSDIPWIVYEEGFLDEQTCLTILKQMLTEESYEFPHCNAHTQEAPQPLPLAFDPICDFMLEANKKYWNFDLGNDPAAWLLTYFEGNSYPEHMDDTPGVTRKLTAVTMLSKPEHYDGGELEIYIPPNRLVMPRTQGSIVVYPSWVIHGVNPVTRGMRQIVNLGYFGPPFR